MEKQTTMLTKPSNNGSKSKPAQTVPEYVQGRINAASEAGFGSTKMWVKNASFNEVTELLNSSGFKFTEIQRDPKSVQLEVSW
jgi:hypothetical protein